MMSHGYGMGVGWLLIVFAIVLPTLLLAAGLLIAQYQRNPAATSPQEPQAERVLADRLARGEIGAEEYEQRLRALRADRR
jgi:putative membrane protein